MVRNVSHAASGSSQIVDNMKAVANAAKNTTHGAEETNEAAQKLSTMALELRTLVAQFKYGTNGADRGAATNGGASGASPAFRRAENSRQETDSFAGTIH
jgi:uncharacterized phage infection (PIP) family protein YhgE